MQRGVWLGIAILLLVTGIPPAWASGPAGISDYSYVKLERIQWGSSRYFGDSARGNGLEAAYQFGKNAFVFGSYDRLQFDHLPGYLYQTGLGFGYQQTAGKISAYLKAGYYRRILSGSVMNGGRSYYWQLSYGVRAALDQYFSFIGQIYSDIKPDFGSRPWGVKAGIGFSAGPLVISFMADHNHDVNSMIGRVGFAF